MWLYIIIGLVLLIAIIILISNTKVSVSEYDIKNNKIDKNIKILQLSDLHNRDLCEKLVKIVKKEKPDIIVYSGDMINDYKKDYKNFINLAKSLKEYKSYYSFGNHESRLDSISKNRYYKKILKTNMIILNDSKVSLSRNIRLYGIEIENDIFDDKKNSESKAKEYLDKTFKEIDNERFNILIAHNPLWANVYAKKGFDLTLSGHVHGGVIKLPILGGILSPDNKLFPEYFQGLNKVKKMSIIVSRGLGFCRYIPFRFLNPAEVVVINLMKNK